MPGPVRPGGDRRDLQSCGERNDHRGESSDLREKLADCDTHIPSSSVPRTHHGGVSGARGAGIAPDAAPPDAEERVGVPCGIGAGAATSQGAPRFKVVTSSDALLAFETVRVRARPEGAEPKMETFLNVPEDDVVELLGLAVGRANHFLDARAASSVRGAAMVLTRVEPECWSRDADITAISTLVQGDVPTRDAFCRLSSVPDALALRATAGRVHATFTRDVSVCGPLDCTELVAAGLAPAQRAAKEGIAAYADAVSSLRAKDATYCFRETVPLEQGGATGACEVVGLLSQRRPDKIVVLHRYVWSDQEAARKFETYLADGGPSLAAELCIRVVARALRNGPLRGLSAGALLEPRYRAASCPQQAWDDGGRFPATSVNVLTHRRPGRTTRLPVVWLGLPPGMRWHAAAAPDARGLTPVAAEVVSTAELDAAAKRAQPVTWSIVTEAALDLKYTFTPMFGPYKFRQGGTLRSRTLRELQSRMVREVFAHADGSEYPLDRIYDFFINQGLSFVVETMAPYLAAAKVPPLALLTTGAALIEHDREQATQALSRHRGSCIA